jgi:DNA polymerase-1
MLTVTNGGTHDWENMPLDEMALGNAMDADFTLRAHTNMVGEMKRKGVNHVYEKLLKEILVVASEVEHQGILVDNDCVARFDELLEKEIGELETKLSELSVIDGVNPRSNADMGLLLFTKEGFGLRALEFSKKTKAPSITEAHLQKVAATATGDAKEYIDLLLKYKGRVKQHKTYVKGVEKAIEYNEDNRVYSSYNFGNVVTGRLSCSTYQVSPKYKKGISFHTLPRPDEDDPINLRSMMRADEGKVFVAADFSQAELRVLAQCCKDKNLIEAFNSGQDLHSFTASLVFGKDAKDVTKQERQIAKSVSFLIVYGGGPNKLAEQIGKSVGYCKNIFKAYQDSFPKVFNWINFVHKFVRENGYAVSLFGRRRHLPNVKSPNKKYQYRALRQGMNFVIQSSASDLMLHSILRLQKYLKATGLDAQILATVHDSVEVQCSRKDLKKVIELMRYVLESTEDFKELYGLDFVVPFAVDVEAGYSFGDMIDAEFSSEGHLLNEAEIIDYVETS